MVNKTRLIKLTQKLIQIDSQNPPGNESAIALFVKGYLNSLGLEAKLYAFKKGRANIMAVLKGSSLKHSLLITPHLDTVPAGRSWKRKPLAGSIEKNRIYGLGATDCKGNLACALEAINSLIDDKVVLGYNLVFAATADEESGSGLGLIPLLNKGILRPDAAVVLDADDFQIIITQKGLIHLKVKIQGKRAHGAYPDRGINAIDIAMDIIRQVKIMFSRLHYVKNRYLKPPTVNVGTISGGVKVNIVAGWGECELDLRYLPGDSAPSLLRAIKGIIRKEAKKFAIEEESVQAPYFINETHPLIKHLNNVMKKNRFRPSIEGSEGATVITFFQEKN